MQTKKLKILFSFTLLKEQRKILQLRETRHAWDTLIIEAKSRDRPAKIYTLELVRLLVNENRFKRDDKIKVYADENGYIERLKHRGKKFNVINLEKL